LTVGSESGETLVPKKSDSLDSWLEWLETIHPVSIDMGLDRVGKVADRLSLRPVSRPLVLVGGTNGKGSTVGMLCAIYTAAGYRVGSYTSPHISDFRERIRVNGAMADAVDVVEALAFVENARKPETLTYFEYTTLAAMRVFQRHQCDVYVLEVGLGGRLDATNLWDADCSVITSIALDHVDYLGSDLSVIATEKAAIGRSGKKLVVGDPAPPASLFEFATANQFIIDHVGAKCLDSLPNTGLAGSHQRRNAGCAVAVVNELAGVLPVNDQTMEQALLGVVITARFEQVRHQGVAVLLDVAHNPAGAEALATSWREQYGDTKAQIIFACLADKDLVGIVNALAPVVDHWHCVPLDVPRAMSNTAVASMIEEHGNTAATAHPSVALAISAALSDATDFEQSILVAGSFHTIADVRAQLDLPVAH